MTPEAIEQDFIRELSTGDNQIGKSQQKTERRERVRQAIYVNSKVGHKFDGTTMTYAEAFKAAYGERLDRRAASREPPPPEDDGDTDVSTEHGNRS